MLAEALAPLLQFVLGCADDEFDRWRARIGTAVAPVGRTLARFLPALSAVLGPQAGPPEQSELAPGLERERVLQAIARLIACFAAPERPLALLLDDLQWADAGTIQVLERLVQQHRARRCCSSAPIAATRSMRVTRCGPARWPTFPMH
jgi:predicted ATPase